MTIPAHASCPHPHAGRFSSFAYNVVTNANDWLCLTCSDCGAVIVGDHEAYEAYLRAHSDTIPNP